jgi:hypothetical protein
MEREMDYFSMSSAMIGDAGAVAAVICPDGVVRT